jgi:hypothetical protein
MDLVIAETTLEEWKSMASGELRHLPQRLADEFGADDLHVLRIIRIDQALLPTVGISFSEFKKGYKFPSVFYSCPCCSGGAGVETDELTVSQFEKLGGRIIPLGNLILQR